MFMNSTLFRGWLGVTGLLLIPLLGFSQNLLQGGNPLVLQACADFGDGDTFTDSGGSDGDYGNDENLAITFCAEAGETITFTFTAFDVEGEFLH
ncbi:MAG: hypothetical protein R2795_22810 [Saprospiraceae bacterium]